MEGARFRVFTLASGLRIAATGSAYAVNGRLADFVGIWLLPGGKIGYEASSQTSEVMWRDGERPPEADLPVSNETGPIRRMGAASNASLLLDLTESGQARLRFTIAPADETTVAAAGFEIASGKDGMHMVATGRARLVTPAVPTGVTLDGIELWLAPDGGIAYRTGT